MMTLMMKMMKWKESKISQILKASWSLKKLIYHLSSSILGTRLWDFSTTRMRKKMRTLTKKMRRTILTRTKLMKMMKMTMRMSLNKTILRSPMLPRCNLVEAIMSGLSNRRSKSNAIVKIENELRKTALIGSVTNVSVEKRKNMRRRERCMNVKNARWKNKNNVKKRNKSAKRWHKKKSRSAGQRQQRRQPRLEGSSSSTSSISFSSSKS